MEKEEFIMIASKVIRSCLDELRSISKVDMACYDIDGTLSAAAAEKDFDLKPVNIRSFIDSGAPKIDSYEDLLSVLKMAPGEYASELF